MKFHARHSTTVHRVTVPGLRMYYHPAVQAEPAAETRRKVKRSLYVYGWVGLALFAGTCLTVAIATVPWLDVGAHGFDKWDAVLGIGIAATKASLVAAIFMHLNHERKLVYAIIAFGLFNAGGFFIGTFWHFANMTSDRYFYRPSEHPTGLQDPAPNYAGW